MGVIRTVADREFRQLYKDGWMTPLSASKRWGVTESTIYIWLKQSKLEAVVNVDRSHYLLDPKQKKP